MPSRRKPSLGCARPGWATRTSSPTWPPKPRRAAPRLRERVQSASQAAGFGSEITLMRRHLAFAEQGAGWLTVHAPSDDAANRITEVATRFEALCAVRRRRLATEDLL